MAFIIRIAVSTFAVWIAVGVLGGLEFDGSFWNLALIGLILGVINASIKPVLKILSIPVIVITLGLFLLIINWALFAFVIWLSGPDQLDLGLTSAGFWSTFFGALLVSLVSWAASTALSPVSR
ncbi:MAG TPA: phage holin family protein [Acidimicrobiia bacterium]|nr:phage holin family protein [Acidimicrobiia bacterium]